MATLVAEIWQGGAHAGREVYSLDAVARGAYDADLATWQARSLGTVVEVWETFHATHDAGACTGECAGLLGAPVYRFVNGHDWVAAPAVSAA